MIGRRAALFVFVAALFVANGAQAASKGELEARKAFAAGKYVEAKDLFADLYARTLHPVYLRNIGRCYQKLGEATRAIDSFRDYLAKAKGVTAGDRKEVQSYIKEMEDLRAAEQARAIRAPAPAPAPPPPAATPPPDPVPVTPTPTAILIAPPLPAEPTDRDEAPLYKKWWFWTAVGVVAAGAAGALLISGGIGNPPCPSGVVECKK